MFQSFKMVVCAKNIGDSDSWVTIVVCAGAWWCCGSVGRTGDHRKKHGGHAEIEPALNISYFSVVNFKIGCDCDPQDLRFYWFFRSLHQRHNGSKKVEAEAWGQEEEHRGAGHPVHLPILQPREVLRGSYQSTQTVMNQIISQGENGQE